MKVKEGKVYKMRNGDVIGPIFPDTHNFCKIKKNRFYRWNAQGEYLEGTKVSGDSPFDLVEEVKQKNEDKLNSKKADAQTTGSSLSQIIKKPPSTSLSLSKSQIREMAENITNHKPSSDVENE
jgi:hypothetical protein